jgi:beta-lactamase class A
MDLPMRRSFLLSTLCCSLSALPSTAQTRDPGLARLETELARLSTIAGGKVGVGIHHLETGRELYLNADEPFPMASTFKVPVAYQLFTLVDQGKVRLDSMITVQPQDLHPGSGTLSSLFDDPGVSLSLRNLTELMLLISDNSATDMVLKAAGNGPAVNARLAQVGVSGISVDRPTILLIADAMGVKGLGPEETWSRKRFGELAQATTDADRATAREAFLKDRRDTSTPRGMTALLTKIYKKDGLSPAMSDLLMDIMYRCETGNARIKGVLPPNTRVAHKTGTLNMGITNDVGIIDLPDGAGHVVLSVFVKEATGNSEAQERQIAQVARAVYDYFLFNR